MMNVQKYKSLYFLLTYPSSKYVLGFIFYLLSTYPSSMYALGFTFYLLSTYPSSMYALGFTFYLLSFILSKGILFLSPVFRYEYRKVYRNKYLRGGSDRW